MGVDRIGAVSPRPCPVAPPDRVGHSRLTRDRKGNEVAGRRREGDERGDAPPSVVVRPQVAPALRACPDEPTGPERPGTGWRALARRLGRDARTLATPDGVRGAVVESLWVTAHVATYPWGLLRERPPAQERYGYDDLRPLQRGLLVRDVEAAGTPILLIHGMIDNRGIFTRLTRRLRAHGFTRVHSLNYSPATNDIRGAAESLAAEVEELVALSGHERINIVGHSLGGLIARYYVQRLGGDVRVRTLVTLGTPHHGTLAAHLVPARLGRQLRPGSDLFLELDLPAPELCTRVVAYWSDLDQLIVPHDNAALDHADLRASNVLVRGVGHLSLPIAGRVVREVAALLGEPPGEPVAELYPAVAEDEENTSA
jgi:triacylglycerol lipase